VDHVGWKAASLQVRKGEPVASEWIHRVKSRSPDHAVIAMTVIRGIGILRIERKEHRRLPAADPPD
jgi:hypothetical protein